MHRIFIVIIILLTPIRMLSVEKEDAWLAVKEGDAKNDKINGAIKYMISEFGLSSTGKIRVIAKTNKLQISNFSNNGDIVYAIQQMDMVGERLFWLYYFNSSSNKIIRKYDVNCLSEKIADVK